VFLVSQHSRLLGIQFPRDAVFRVNAAWIKSKIELFNLLENINGDVFLDFPQGRTKPPKPVLTFEDLVETVYKFENVKYFAITNCRSYTQIDLVRNFLEDRICLVPKIESAEGIDKFEYIIKALNEHEKLIMLDKEDLYTDLDGDDKKFAEYVELIKEKAAKAGFKVLELQGVIFSTDSYLRNGGRE